MQVRWVVCTHCNFAGDRLVFFVYVARVGLMCVVMFCRVIGVRARMCVCVCVCMCVCVCVHLLNALPLPVAIGVT